MPLILCQKSIFEIYCMVESLSQCKNIVLAFKSCPNPLWTSLIMVCCHSVEETTSLVLLHINCSWSIEKVYQKVFRNLAFLPYLPLYTMHKCFYVSMFQLVQNYHLVLSCKLKNPIIYLQKWNIFFSKQYVQKYLNVRKFDCISFK